MTPLRGLATLNAIASATPTAQSVGLSEVLADWAAVAERLWRARLGWPMATRALALELRKRTISRGAAIDTARADLILLDIQQYEHNWNADSKSFAGELSRVFDAGGDARWASLVEMHSARSVMFAGERGAAQLAFQRWLDAPARADIRDSAWVRTSLGFLQVDSHQEAVGFRNLHEALEMLRALPASPELVLTLMNIGVAHIHFGNFRTAEGLIEEALGIADGMPGFERLNLLAANWARCATQLGESARALARLEPVVARHDLSFDRSFLDVMMADARQRCGQLDAARESLDRAAAALEGAKSGSPAVSVMRVVRLGLLRQEGRLAEAEAALVEAEASPPDYTSHIRGLDLSEEAAKLHAALGNWDKAYEYERRHHEHYVEARRMAEHAEHMAIEAQHSLYLERLDRESGQRDAGETARSQPARPKTQPTGRVEAVRTLQAAFREGTIRDAETGLHNRHFLEQTLPREIARASREFPSVLAMIELDSPGAARAPSARELLAFSQLLRDETQDTDLAFRYEGMVFCWLLGDADIPSALERCRILQERCGGLRLGTAAPQARLSFCAGLAEVPRQGSDANELLALADAALYRARMAGPAHVMVAVDASL